MARPRLPTLLTRRDTVAILLILVGVFGMARHFSAKLDLASLPRATSSTGTAPPLPNVRSVATPADGFRLLRTLLIKITVLKSWSTIPSRPHAVAPHFGCWFY